MRKVLLLAVALTTVVAASAQKVIGNGQVSGSFESSSIYYTPDKRIERPEDHFGSNNYLKVDYANGRFSAGVQVNAFLPALVGYEHLADGYKFYLASKYIQWRDKNYEFLVGDIYDQFGSGLIFRSFEDRQLGMNNSLEGVRAMYRFGKYVSIKGVYGRPRLNTEYSKSWVRGADLVVSLSDIIGVESMALSLEGSYVNRFESFKHIPNNDEWSWFVPADYNYTNPNLNMYSGRLNFDWNGLTLHGEYVHKSNDFNINEFAVKNGWAAIGEVGYNYKTFSIMATFRALDQMVTPISLYDTSVSNMINYIPALTRQYTYMLANLNPYQVPRAGELGGQADLCYTYRSKSNRYRYWNFHANFSTFYSMNKAWDSGKRALLWRDINVDVERQWDKKWKSLLLYSYQEYNGNKAHIFVGDVQHKFNRKMSLRFELQYLYSPDDPAQWNETHSSGDWVAGLVEFNIAPKWSIYVQDMYNIGMTKTHYYNGGFSYTYNRTRVQLSYGRNRAGYICSGGVCRYSPAYTGVNLMLTSSF